MPDGSSCRNPYCDRVVQNNRRGWCHRCYQLFNAHGLHRGNPDIPAIAGVGGTPGGQRRVHSIKTLALTEVIHSAVNLKMPKDEFLWRRSISDTAFAQYELDHDFSYNRSVQYGLPVHFSEPSQSEVFLHGFKYPKVEIVKGKPNKYRVVLTPEQTKELHQLISPSAVKYLEPQEYLLYWLMARRWGSIKRRAIFSILGVDSVKPEDRLNIRSKLAVRLGSTITDMGISVESYLATWRDSQPPPPDVAGLHQQLIQLLPSMYKAAALLLADSKLLMDKQFGDAVVVVEKARVPAQQIYNQLILRYNWNQLGELMQVRREWMTEMWFLADNMSLITKSVVGSDQTSTLDIN